MSIRTRVSRTIVFAAWFAASLGACTTWSRRSIPAPGRDQFFATARVTRTGEESIVLDSVTVSRDSVIGREHSRSRARVAIPVFEVRNVEARRADPVGTVVVVLVTILTAVVLWASYEVRKLGTD